MDNKWVIFIDVAVILIIVICLLYCICRKPVISDSGVVIESFKYPEMNINAAILYTVYKADKYDYEFVEKWHKDIAFYIVNNGVETEWFKKMKELPGVHVLTRENKGWDLGGWKAGIEYWPELAKYDTVALVNNSCVYLIDVYTFFAKSIGYDMYGISQCICRVLPYHLSATFIAVSKNLYNSDVFKEHWKKARMNGKHD